MSQKSRIPDLYSKQVAKKVKLNINYIIQGWEGASTFYNWQSESTPMGISHWVNFTLSSRPRPLPRRRVTNGKNESRARPEDTKPPELTVGKVHVVPKLLPVDGTTSGGAI